MNVLNRLGAKQVSVHIKGCGGFAVAFVPNGLSVYEFKQLLNVDSRVQLFASTNLLPLPDGVNLYQCVDNFDAIYLEA